MEFPLPGGRGQRGGGLNLFTLTPTLSRLRAEPFSGQARQGRGGSVCDYAETKFFLYS